MILICEHSDEQLERLCYACESKTINDEDNTEKAMIGIDEQNLAWFYIAPEYRDREISQQLVRLALDLIGPEAWAVVQTSGGTDHALFTETGLRVVESFENEADGEGGINVHLTQTS
jgi:ribosomal protein S18 acetylase RimI-like enzyme